MTIKTFRIVIDGVEHFVEVEEIKDGNMATSVPHVMPTASASTVTSPSARPVPKTVASSPTAASGKDINAPLQGTVLDVTVKVGDTVKTGDILVIIEAMKMENELVAPTNGVIGSVHVNKGDVVRAGDQLISFQ